MLQMPDELTVRELRLKVEQPGFRVDELVLVTTMRGRGQYTQGGTGGSVPEAMAHRIGFSLDQDVHCKWTCCGARRRRWWRRRSGCTCWRTT